MLFLLFFALWPSAAPAPGAPVILVLGDSLSAAYGIPRDAGWVSLLQRRLDTKKWDYRVVNASISGETSRGGRYRIAPTLEEHRPAIVILELGGNDGLRGLSLAETESNLAAIIETCRRYRATVVLVGMRLPPNYGKTYTGKFQDVYSRLASSFRLPFVPFLLEGIADRPELFQSDGIHPTAAAQPAILENVWKVLLPLLKHRKGRPDPLNAP